MTESSKREDRRIVLVTGTDTGVGKTVVAAGLARALSDRGVRVVAIKPVESGCGETVSETEDGRILAKAAGQVAPTEALTRLRAPVAPPVAADEEGFELKMGAWAQRIFEYAKSAQVVLVEGAGGLLSPLTWKETARELAVDLGARALVVASDKLGTLNHTLLTLEALDRAGVVTQGVVFNAPDAPDDSTGKNRESLLKFRPGLQVASLPRVRSWEESAQKLKEVSHWILP
jgi:dethiobiotin synthetase